MEWCLAADPDRDGDVWFVLEEIGLAAELDIVHVAPAEPAIEDGLGRVVLSTTRTYQYEVLELWFTGSDEPVDATTGHRFFSADRCDWITAAELHPGESIETIDGGSSQLVSSVLLSKPQWVYNIEVDTDHSYFVGELGLLVHNAGGCAPEVRAANIEKGIPESQLGPSGKPKIHNAKNSTRKKAKDATQGRSRGKPVEHPNDKGQDPHFHATDRNGNKLTGKDNIHQTYPPSQSTRPPGG